MAQQALTLQLKNYRRFVTTGVIAFEPGLTIISGLNGSGKSTLIEAFIYALFGPGTKGGQGIFDIHTDSLNEPVRVECKLFIDDQEVHIMRFGMTAELRINSAIQVQGGAGSAKSVTARIIALLGGLSREQFERTYVALQGDTAGLVTEKANERRQIIEKILQGEVPIDLPEEIEV
jgi:DNA repair protein SbcC/Rad50